MSDLPQVTLHRKPEYPRNRGTPGDLTLPGGKKFATIENPNLDNLPNVSRIPSGVYRCEWEEADWSRFGDRYEVKDVPGRTDILFHAGNNTDDTHGCILLGTGHDEHDCSIWGSRAARETFEHLMDKQPFELVIYDALEDVVDEVGHQA